MATTAADDYTVISTKSSLAVAPDYEEMNSAKIINFDVTFVKALREHFPKFTVTLTYSYVAPLLLFADVEPAEASYVLDIESESIFRYRSYLGYGELGESRIFAKYIYYFENMKFIVFVVDRDFDTMQYILKEPDVEAGETPMSNCAATEALIRTVGLRFEDHSRPDTKYIYLYDHGYWTRSKSLWEDIHSSTWDKVILAPKLKKDLTSVTSRFFDSEDIYKRYGVQWKRGLILYGPPGNGKTISIKALMRDLAKRDKPIASLYVKTATSTYDIQEVFEFARYMTPCLLVLEDVDSIVNKDTRSYFFNEIDGLARNDGMMMAASTNFINKLDPGLAARPSRFDRKFKFPLPSPLLRAEYARFWRKKLEKRAPSIDFPETLIKPMARITGQFSFAFMQEAFISSLLQMARDDEDDGGEDNNLDVDDDDMGAYDSDSVEEMQCDESRADQSNLMHREKQKSENGLKSNDREKDDPLDKYHLWRAFKASVETLRKDIQHKNNIGFSMEERNPDDSETANFKNQVGLSARFSEEDEFFLARPTDERVEFVSTENGGTWTVRASGAKLQSRGQAAFHKGLFRRQFPHGIGRRDQPAPFEGNGVGEAKVQRGSRKSTYME